MEQFIGVNQSICPACGKPNSCAVANSQEKRSTYSEDSKFSCWCFREKSKEQWQVDKSNAMNTILPKKTDRMISCFCHECFPST